LIANGKPRGDRSEDVMRVDHLGWLSLEPDLDLPLKPPGGRPDGPTLVLNTDLADKAKACADRNWERNITPREQARANVGRSQAAKKKTNVCRRTTAMRYGHAGDEQYRYLLLVFRTR
jgi:hypothetical protein